MQGRLLRVDLAPLTGALAAPPPLRLLGPLAGGTRPLSVRRRRGRGGRRRTIRGGWRRRRRARRRRRIRGRTGVGRRRRRIRGWVGVGRRRRIRGWVGVGRRRRIRGRVGVGRGRGVRGRGGGRRRGLDRLEREGSARERFGQRHLPRLKLGERS